MRRYLAYDKKSKKMRKVKSLVFEGDGYKDDDTDFSMANLWGKDCIENKNIIVQREAKDVILMQLIGKKDINENELHENAIIKYDIEYEIFDGAYNEYGLVGVIKYNEKSCGYQVVENDCGCPVSALNNIEKIGVMPMDSELLGF